MQSHKSHNNYKQAAVVQLVGDMRQNIDELLRSINCQCGANNHLKIIFNIYCNKIQKLRIERDELRQKCQQLSRRSEIYMKENYNVLNEYESTSNTFRKPVQSQILSDNRSVFEILNKEIMMLPLSVSTQRQDSLHYSESMNENLLSDQEEDEVQNPQESMLITQRSYKNQNQPPSQVKCKDKESRKIEKMFKPQKKDKEIIRNFEQFLKQKIQQNYNKIKICEDQKEINKNMFKRKNKSPHRKPLTNKIIAYNN